LYNVLRLGGKFGSGIVSVFVVGVGVGVRVCGSVEAETVYAENKNRQIKPIPITNKIDVEAGLAL